eukprot:11351775-Karenia_brevis.AAC.1
MRAFLAVEHYGQGVTGVTVWSDSKMVVDGYTKGKGALQSVLCTDWEELWDRADALANRGTSVHLQKVKSHTTDASIVAKQQQVGNWLANHVAKAGAQGCQLTASEIQPITKKDRVLWQLQSRMIVVIHTMPTRATILKDQLAVALPTASEKL